LAHNMENSCLHCGCAVHAQNSVKLLLRLYAHQLTFVRLWQLAVDAALAPVHGSLCMYVCMYVGLHLLLLHVFVQVYKTQEGLPACQLSPHTTDRDTYISSTHRPQPCISNTITGPIPLVIALMVSSKVVMPSFPLGQTPCLPMEEHSCLLHCRRRQRATCLITIRSRPLPLFLHPWTASCTPSPTCPRRRRQTWLQQRPRRRFAGR